MTTATTLAGIEVPTQELHARFFAGGLTVYGHEAIIEALTEMNRLVEEECQLVLQASEIIRPYNTYAGDIAYAPEPVQKLDEVTCLYTPTFSTGNTKHGGKQEQWPVSKWKKEMATYRRVIGKLRKALDACQELTEPTPVPHAPEERAIIDEEDATAIDCAYSRKLREDEAMTDEMLDDLEQKASAAWDKLLEMPDGCDLRDIGSFVEVQEFADLTSKRIGLALSIQFDSQNRTVLLASDDAQILMSLADEESLYHILSDRYEARHAAMHRAFYRNYK